MDYHNATNEDALKAWDAGEPIWTCEMGGMGPGYEQCIQLMGFEMFRAMIAQPPEDWSKLTGDDGRDAWRSYRDAIEKLPAVKSTIETLGPSGAQFGAAMSLASTFAINGYATGMEKVPKDRRILVSKNFPTLSQMASA
jgi:hypothetical protein